MKRSIVLVLLFATIAINASTKDSLLIALENAIENRVDYVGQKLQRIAKIQSSIAESKSDKELYYKYNALFSEYKSLNFDSAFTYARKLNDLAQKIGDNEKIALAKTNMSFILLSAGMFKETLDSIQAIEFKYLNDSAKFNYFSMAARAYFDMADYASETYFYNIYNTRGKQFIAMAIQYCTKDDARYCYLLGLKALRDGNWAEAKKYLEKQIFSFQLNKQDYAIAASSLAYIYLKTNELEKSYAMLIEAAKTDILLGTKETSAIRSLAELEFRHGDVKRAYRYIKLALDDAYYYGARYRRIQISYILPIIEEKHLQEVESHKKQLLTYLISISVLAFLLVIFVALILKLNKKLRLAKTDLAHSNQKLSLINSQLVEANQIKEEYIGQFFNIISEYIEKIEKFKKTINRKLATNNMTEIKDTVDAINPKKEREELYMSFDKIFMKVFPGFIDRFNLLLKTDERFIVKEYQPLLPELRIIALMRLGIADPEKIAKILNYSIHTIYTYKAKIKSKALAPNELFDSKDIEMQLRGI